MQALIFPAILIVVMYMVLIRPQQKRQREASELLRSLEVGDEVVLNSGIHGFVNSLEDDIIWLTVAPDLELKVSRSAVVHRVLDPNDTLEDDDTDADDDPSIDMATDFIESDG